MKYLVAGLGNIGPEYELTRHNVGFLVLDHLSSKLETNFTADKHASMTEAKYKGRNIYLIKPSTYMNLSGKAVNYWLQELKIPTENFLVVTDDIALPFGKLRMRGKGSNAGHNGLGSIDETLGYNSYARLRFGIGNNFSKGRQVDYVLSRFTEQEFQDLEPLLVKASDMVLSFCTIGIERTMNFFND
ncbi:aminoacyl-tRNA hydrolase [soil metagenome]